MAIDDIKGLDDLRVEVNIECKDGSVKPGLVTWKEFVILTTQVK